MKNNFLFKTIAAAFLFVFAAVSVNAQSLKVPASSPSQTLKQSFALSEITIDYSRPSAKSRVIFGGLVPFDKIWRTGANQSTKVTFGEDVKVEGKDVKAGTYAIYTIPKKDSWEIMLYKDLTLGGGVDEYKTENELIRFSVRSISLGNKVETFTIQVENITATSCKIEMSWDMTRVSFNVSTEIDAKVMKNIESVMSKDARPYHSAANYYYENDKDLKVALDWANKAIESRPEAYWSVHLKAKIQLKMNDAKGAITTAEQSMALAKTDKNDDYVKLNETLIMEAKKKK